jgi:alkylated DNA repair dioxygenase AlkB
MPLPDLTALTESKKPRRDLVPNAPNGVYCLNQKDSVELCNSSVLLYRNALAINDGEFEEAANFMINKVEQQYFMGNLVPRKQCTFGPVKYKTYQHVPNEAEWPSVVERVRKATQAFAAQLGIPNPEEYTGVHANYYADAMDSVAEHSDAEKQLIKGAPIFSYTYIIDNNDSLARGFQIYRMTTAGDVVDGKGQVADVTLRSGDLLVMMGDMQQLFNHGIKKQPGKEIGARLNFTVRKFVPSEQVMKRKLE